MWKPNKLSLLLNTGQGNSHPLKESATFFHYPNLSKPQTPKTQTQTPQDPSPKTSNIDPQTPLRALQLCFVV